MKRRWPRPRWTIHTTGRSRGRTGGSSSRFGVLGRVVFLRRELRKGGSQLFDRGATRPRGLVAAFRTTQNGVLRTSNLEELPPVRQDEKGARWVPRGGGAARRRSIPWSLAKASEKTPLGVYRKGLASRAIFVTLTPCHTVTTPCTKSLWLLL